ncbi:YitT family protein [Paenibacillus agricola]|uniref:YitT family protein n=1 Tax=Paenibacillus agricola TaxID=2716264 RepID=UPI0035D4FC34
MLTLPKFTAIVVGSILIAIGINFFLVPHRVLDGGVIGISLIINYLFDAKIGLVIIACSIPIFIVAWFHNRPIFYDSLAGMIISSLIIDFLAPFQYYFLYYVELTSISSAIIGGMIAGTGFGVMLRYETSTGGIDLLAQFLSKYISVNVGIILFVMDALIIGVGVLLLSGDTLMLSVLTIIAGGVATGLCNLKKV